MFRPTALSSKLESIMSIETIEGIEEIQRDEVEVLEEQQEEKKLRIHLPIKQASISSYGSRRSSITAAAVVGKSNLAQEVKTSEKFQSFSVIKEKRKLRSLKQDVKRRARRKTSGKKKSKQKEEKPSVKTKTTSDNEDYESEPDVSEIILTKPTISVVVPENEEANQQTKDELKALLKKKRKKRKKKGRIRKRRIGQICDPVAEELEQLLQEKDRLLREELAKLDPKVAPSKPDSSFFPAPKSLEKRRCYFHRDAKALKCTVCSGGFSTVFSYQLIDYFYFQFITERKEHSGLTSGF